MRYLQLLFSGEQKWGMKQNIVFTNRNNSCHIREKYARVFLMHKKASNYSCGPEFL